MRVISLLLVLFGVVQAGTALAGDSSDAVADGYKVQFGLFSSEADPETGAITVNVQETLDIPQVIREDGFLFGVKIVPPNEDPFEVRLIHELPLDPKAITGGSTESTAGRIIEGKPHQIMGVEVFPFSFDPGDPVGEYGLRVLVNGVLSRSIRYRVFVPGTE